MTIYCTLKRESATAQQTEYRVIDASHGFASVEKRNPSWLEDPAAFEVPTDEINTVAVVDDETGERVEAEMGYAFDLDSFNKKANALAWHETKDMEAM